ncbi:hypothetical protein PS850_06158 [Pseudomonas fluorescens]|nr:hypothetical protein PS850_06158 [Pseudomonas fluorescens]
MSDDPVIRVRVAAQTLGKLRDFIDETQPDLGCRPAARHTEAGFVTDVYLSESRLAAARTARSAADVNLTVLENTTEIGLARQAEVGQGNRFAARKTLPRGLGRKE